MQAGITLLKEVIVADTTIADVDALCLYYTLTVYILSLPQM